MYQKNVTLDNADLIVVEWEEGLKNMTIKKDGQVIGAFTDEHEAKQGRRFVLPDRREITVVYTEFGLEVWQNGKEMVSGAKSGSVNAFSNAVKGLTWVGSAQLILAPILFFIARSSNPEEALSVGLGLVVAGGLLVGLGQWAKRTGSKTPFWIGIGFCALNILLTLAAGSGSGIIITGILAYYLYKGTQAEAPEPAKKIFQDPNAPLDSDL